METNKNTFTKAVLIVLTVCAVAILVILSYQVLVSEKSVSGLEAQLAACEDELASVKEEMEGYKATTSEQLSTYESELKSSKETIKALEGQIKDLTTSKQTIISGPSSTAEYKAWVEAQSALEPYDLYDDLSLAYEQLVEHYDNGYDGTELYDASLKLLVPSSQRSKLDSYMKTLNRYFDYSSYYTPRNNFIDDLVSAKLLIDEGNDTYSWYYDTLTTKNVVSKLNVTTDVANAMLGLLRTIGWDV